jgi:aryl-alcohol dehydrogenase-like predicted oxidoreductase
VYAPDGAQVGHNEALVAEAVAAYSGPRPVVATKGGLTRDASERWGRAGDPDALLAAAEASTERIGQIDLYYLHRADPAVPYGRQIEGLCAVQEAGLTRRIGVSNVDAAMLRRAVEVAGGPTEGGIVAVQNERSPQYRADSDVLDLCSEYGIAYLPWSPLTGSHLFAAPAQARRVSPQRLTLAWLLAQSPVVIPIPGSTRPETILDSVAAVDLRLSPAEVVELSGVPASDASLYPDSEPKPGL